MPTQTASRGVRLAVEVDRAAAGLAHSVEGGYAYATVIKETPAPDKIVRKRIGAVNYEEITVACGTEMSKGFYEWIKAWFDHKYVRRDGAIHNCDFDGNVVSTLEWQRALISEIGFPASDAAAKDAALMTVKIAPESTRRKAGTGKLDISKYLPIKQKNWRVSNFRFSLQGCEDATRQVSSIGAFSIKQQILEYPSGTIRDYQKESANLEIPNLVINLAESHSDKFYDWHQSFVIDGKNDPDQEKTAILEYLATDSNTVLFTLNFRGLGIFKLTPEKVEAGGENIRRVKAEMYCEEITFKYGGDIA